MRTMMKMVMGMVMVGVLLACTMCSPAFARTNAVGSYNSVVHSNAYEPGKGQVLDSSGTIWDTVDDFWSRFSTQTAFNAPAINVRLSTAVSMPVALTVTVTNLKIDGTSNTVQVDATKMVPVGINATSNTVKVDATNITRVGIDATSNTVTVGNVPGVKPELNASLVAVSTSFLCNPDKSNALSLNAAATSFTYFVSGGTATITTSWGGDSYYASGQDGVVPFGVGSSSAATVTVWTGGATTVGVTLTGVRDTR